MMRSLAGWACALALVLWRLTCRYRVIDDPRPALRRRGRPYAYALLHAHQVSALFVNDEPRMAAMVSRSRDGDILAPCLRIRRVLPVRGSGRKQGVDKGGGTALAALCEHVRHRVPALLAVDGPRGPRNHVHRGIVDLARRTGAVILPVVVVPSRRWIFTRAWDRLQLPHPFSTVLMAFGAPLDPAEHRDDGTLRALVAARLGALEAEYDAVEGAHAGARPRHDPGDVRSGQGCADGTRSAHTRSS